MAEPIKRKEALKPLSRDHHHSLLLCWKIREGFKRNTEPERIKKYVDWFWLNYLRAHFEFEEQVLFPILGNDNTLIKKAISEHRRLSRLIHSNTDIYKNLNLLEEELDSHIRFEERILFKEIELVCSDEQLNILQNHDHNLTFEENNTDTFWKI